MKALWSRFDETASQVLGLRAQLDAPAGQVRNTVAALGPTVSSRCGQLETQAQGQQQYSAQQLQGLSQEVSQRGEALHQEGLAAGHYASIADDPIRPSAEGRRSNPRSTAAKLRHATRSAIP